jgi:hypothetical protein
MSKSTFAVVLAIPYSGIAKAQTQTQAQTQIQPRTRTSEVRQFHVDAPAGSGHSSGGANQFQIGGGAAALVYKGLSVGGELSRAMRQIAFDLFSASGGFHFLTRGRSGR